MKMWYKNIKMSCLSAALVVIVILAPITGCALPGVSTTQLPTIESAQAASQVTISPLALQPSIATAGTSLSLPDFTSLIAQARRSVVAITAEVTARAWGRTFTQEGEGSGWIIAEDGLIVTNYHVVEGANSLTVTLENSGDFPAHIIGTDQVNDIALIKIDVSGLPALNVGDSSKLQVGEWVVALGNSLGLGISATKGIVSALDVSLSGSGETLKGLVQTDAAINPGNSGGPLLNLAGEVVGINSAKIAQIGVEGMGYAISMEEALPVYNRLKSNVGN
jgi:serine protease Do